MRKRKVILLGSTGSIGTSAIKVAETIPERMEVAGMAAFQSAAKLAEAANRLRPQAICLVNSGGLRELRDRLVYNPLVFTGEEGLVDLATLPGADLVLVAITGTAGLRPTLAGYRFRQALALSHTKI